MKVWVMTKKQAVFLAAAIVIVITAMVVGKGGSVTVSGKKRDLPIYCVDKGDEKIASISFDAAWATSQCVPKPKTHIISVFEYLSLLT